MANSTFPNLLWRETPLQHFATPDGMFIKDGSLGEMPFTCRSIPHVALSKDGSLIVGNADAEAVMRKTWRNIAAQEILQPIGIPFISAWYALPLPAKPQVCHKATMLHASGACVLTQVPVHCFDLPAARGLHAMS